MGGKGGKGSQAQGKKRKSSNRSPQQENQEASRRKVTNMSNSYTQMLGQGQGQGQEGLNGSFVKASQTFVMPGTSSNVGYTYSPNTTGNTQGFQVMNNGHGIVPTTPVAAYNLPQYSTSTPMSSNSPNNIDPFALILSRLDNMDMKLGQLEKIQTTVNGLTVSMYDIGQKVEDMEKRIRDLESSRQFDCDAVNEIKQKQNEIDSLKSKVSQMETQRSECEDIVNEMKCADLKNNLLFFRVNDDESETTEQCHEKIVNIMKEEMKINNASHIQIIKAERMGKYKLDKIRPIVVRYGSFDEREIVRKSCKNLKRENPVGVSQHYPKDIADKRKALGPVLRKAKRDKKKVELRYDKLFINDILYVPPQAE